MEKFAKITDKQMGTVDVFEGNDISWAIMHGYTEMPVEQGINGFWYMKGFAPQIENTYKELRASAYEPISDQLDNLYHDITNGLFGESALNSSFYLNRKSVKDNYPK